MGKAMRLDKLLGHTGWGTRKELKDLCKSGQVTINGDICRDSSRKVDPDQDVVALAARSYRTKNIFISCSISPLASSRLRKTTCRRRLSTSCRKSIRAADCFPWAGWIKIRRAFCF